MAHKLAFATALIFSLVILAQAAVQHEDFGAALEKIGRPIAVDGNLSFQKMIPGYNYSSQIKVSWAVPMDAVMGLEDQAVKVYVQARPFADNSWIVFEMAGKKRKVLTFEISCNVTDGACGIGSALVKRFTATVQTPLDAAYPHYENIVIESSLAEFPLTEEGLAEKQAAEALASADENAAAAKAALPDSILVADAGDALAQAQIMIDNGDFGSALALIGQAGYTLEKAMEATPPAPEPTVVADEQVPARVASAVSGFFAGRNMPYILGLVVLAAVVIAFMFARRGQQIDVDKLMDEGDGGLLAKKGGGSNLNALNRAADNEGDRGFSFSSSSAPKPGDSNYSPKTSFLDRYKNK